MKRKSIVFLVLLVAIASLFIGCDLQVPGNGDSTPPSNPSDPTNPPETYIKIKLTSIDDPDIIYEIDMDYGVDMVDYSNAVEDPLSVVDVGPLFANQIYLPRDVLNQTVIVGTDSPTAVTVENFPLVNYSFITLGIPNRIGEYEVVDEDVDTNAYLQAIVQTDSDILDFYTWEFDNFKTLIIVFEDIGGLIQGEITIDRMPVCYY